jgi:hypothetical protein
VFGLVVPAVLRMLGKLAQDATVAFALAVILLVAITYTLQAVAGGRHARLRPDGAPPPQSPSARRSAISARSASC